MKHIYGFLNTNPLWTHTQFGLQQFEMPAIDITTFVPQPIPSNLRLGHQVEYIFKQLLEHSNAYKVLAHNIQIKRGNETIGEFDFILEDLRDFPPTNTENTQDKLIKSEKRKLLHIELTYKFYIIDPSISEPVHRLIGPNRKDLFFAKMEKTRDRQMPLLFSPEGTQTLAALDIDANELVQQTYFIGQLFTPYNQVSPSIQPLNTDAVVGFWIPIEQFNTEIFKAHQFYIPHKYEWLQEPHLNVCWKCHSDILIDINARHLDKRSPMVWVHKKNDSLEKYFVLCSLSV